MAISAKDVKGLRERTGLGMMECKQALTETDGDVEAAIALLRERLGSKMNERSGREASEGAIAVAIKGSSAAIVKLLAETDFAARNEGFQKATAKLAELMLEAEDGEITEPTEAMKPIIEDLRITIKENISLAQAAKITAEKIGHYVHHNNKLGVIIAGEGDLDDELMTGLCQHLVAAVPPMMPEPIAIEESDLPAEKVEEAKAQFVKEAQETGKPAEIAEKIATGKLAKWKSDHTLMGQDYIRDMDNKKPVRDYLPKGAKVTNYVRYAL